jgi:hypothetical protein
MAKKAGKRGAARKAATVRPPARRPPAQNKKEKIEDAFEASLLAHGQAAPRQADGTLPPGATHEITVGENSGKKIVRRRFSIL